MKQFVFFLLALLPFSGSADILYLEDCEDQITLRLCVSSRSSGDNYIHKLHLQFPVPGGIDIEVEGEDEEENDDDSPVSYSQRSVSNGTKTLVEFEAENPGQQNYILKWSKNGEDRELQITIAVEDCQADGVAERWGDCCDRQMKLYNLLAIARHHACRAKQQAESDEDQAMDRLLESGSALYEYIGEMRGMLGSDRCDLCTPEERRAIRGSQQTLRRALAQRRTAATFDYAGLLEDLESCYENMKERVDLCLEPARPETTDQ